jgi:superfamily I DNA and RNA helicase
MAILKSDFMRWYNQHSMGSKMDVAWAAVKMAEAAEGVQTQTTNSRYVAALALYEEYLTVTSFGADTTFKLWCKERLNAAKAPHCT